MYSHGTAAQEQECIPWNSKRRRTRMYSMSSTSTRMYSMEQQKKSKNVFTWNSSTRTRMYSMEQQKKKNKNVSGVTFGAFHYLSLLPFFISEENTVSFRISQELLHNPSTRSTAFILKENTVLYAEIIPKYFEPNSSFFHCQ